MGKKKGKQATAKADASDDEDGGEEDVGDLMAKMGLAGDEPPAVDVSDVAPAPKEPKEEADASDGPTLSSTIAVAGRKETRHVAAVPYCPISSLPFEYCEFSPLFKKCRENFEANYEEYYPDVEGEEGLAELMASLGMTGGDAASKRAQSAKKPSDPTAPPQSGSGKKKDAAAAQIVIELNNRNKKKHITTVKGLELFGADAAAAAKLFGKRFACGSSLKKGAVRCRPPPCGMPPVA